MEEDLKIQLHALYEEIMWLRARPNITSSVARSWYTHACAERLKKRIRRFSGYVSLSALNNPTGVLRLEHHHRIQTTLTQLVERHHTLGINDPIEFAETLLQCEDVHIVTRDENYAAMRSKGNYEEAGIELVHWENIERQIQETLKRKMLKGKVSNAHGF